MWAGFLLLLAQDSLGYTPEPGGMNVPATVLSGIPFQLSFPLQWDPLASVYQPRLNYTVSVSGSNELVLQEGGFSTLDSSGRPVYEMTLQGLTIDRVWHADLRLCIAVPSEPWTCQQQTAHVIPGFLSLVPTLALLMTAVWSRQVLLALSVGIFFSSLFINNFNPGVALLRFVDQYLLLSIADKEHVYILLFVFFLGGMIGLVQKGGGAQAFANYVSGLAQSHTGVQWFCFLFSMCLFFDDYSNILITAGSMDGAMHKFKVSPEKFACLVHTMATCLACVAPMSSWIGFELSLIQEQFDVLHIDEDPYLFFLQTIPSRFFPFFMFALLFCTIGLGREFGSMLVAERRMQAQPCPAGDVAQNETQQPDQIQIQKSLYPIPGKPQRIMNAAVPLLCVIFGVLAGMVATGYHNIQGSAPSARNVFASADSFKALLWASSLGSLVAAVLVILQKILTPAEAIQTWLEGIRQVLEPCIILVFAWALGDSMVDLFTAQYINSEFDGLDVKALPCVTFIVAAVVSFCTGTAWGTMSIMFPLMLPLVDSLAPGDSFYLRHVGAAILAGAVVGDNCSPISDSTILTALSTKCEVRDHVITNIAYCIPAFLLSILFLLLVGYKMMPVWVANILGVLSIAAFVGVFAQRLQDSQPTSGCQTQACFRRFGCACPWFWRSSEAAGSSEDLSLDFIAHSSSRRRSRPLSRAPTGYSSLWDDPVH
eukprot:g70972.t1